MSQSSEQPSIMERYKERLSTLTISEKINYQQILLMHLYKVMDARGTPFYGIEVDHLLNRIPTPWQDEQFKKDLLDAESILAKAEDSCDKKNVKAAEEGEWNPEEDDAPYTIDYDTYFASVEHAIINLFNRIGIMMKPIPKEVI